MILYRTKVFDTEIEFFTDPNEVNVLHFVLGENDCKVYGSFITELKAAKLSVSQLNQLIPHIESNYLAHVTNIARNHTIH